MHEIDVADICVECGSGDLALHGEDKVCNNCGLLFDEAQSTKNSAFNGTCHSGGFPKEEKFRFNRPWDIKVTNPTERALFQGLQGLNRTCDLLELPNEIKVKSAEIYRKVVEKDLLWGRSVKGFIADILPP